MTILVNAGTTISIPSDGIALTDTGTIAGVLNGAGTIGGPFLLEIQSGGELFASTGPVSINTGQIFNQGTIQGGASTNGATIAASVNIENLSAGTLSGGTWDGEIAFLNGTINTDNASITDPDKMTEQGTSGVQSIGNTLSSITPTGTLITLENSPFSITGSLVDSGFLELLSFSSFTVAGGLTIASGGTLDFGDIVAPQGVTIEAGATMNASDSSINGPLTVNGMVNGGLFVSGTVGGTGTIDFLFMDPGTTLLPGLSSSSAEVMGTGTVSVQNNPSGTISFQGIINTPTIPVLEVSNSFTGTIAVPDALETVPQNDQVLASGPQAEVVLQSPSSFTGTITDFDNTSTLVLQGDIANTASLNVFTDVLTFSNGGSVVGSLKLVPQATQTSKGFVMNHEFARWGQSYSAATFTATSNLASDNTTITASGISDNLQFFSCFASGTRIATLDGEVPIEKLRPGDRVFAHFGGERRVVWIGYRALDRSGSADDAVLTVRIAAGAFGRSRPTRDLFVSPDHAVFVEDVLIPAKYLINGTTIREIAVNTVTYWHVELNEHDVILADGLPTESYLDHGDRSSFTNHDGDKLSSTWHGSLAWETAACAPLVVTGPILAAARAKVREMVLA